MNPVERAEAVSATRAILTAVGNTIASDTGRPGADFRRALGDLYTEAEVMIEAAALAYPLADCFDLARLAGASLDAMGRARVTIGAQSPAGGAAIAIVNAAVLFVLVQEALILADTTLASRDDVDRYLDRMNAAFDVAETTAADSADSSAYRAIVSLHAAVANDLTTRARPLPQMVQYTFPTTVAALWLSNRLYGGADRVDELIAENRPVHPAFMAAAGRALSR